MVSDGRTRTMLAGSLTMESEAQEVRVLRRQMPFLLGGLLPCAEVLATSTG